MAGPENDPQDAPASVPVDAVRAQLARILASADFAKSDRMSRFLSFVVEQALTGQADRLKGYTIGIEVFDRPSDFDPQSDPIVRVEAGRLRDRLSRYYAKEGAQDPLRIDIPKGAYAPRFETVAKAEASQTPLTAPAGPATRRLAAILSADAAGFSQLMERNEEKTLAALKMVFETVFRPKVTEHGGRIVKLIGDGVLAEFSSVIAATTCAMEIQAEVAALMEDLPEEESLRFRIGIHLGDVIADEEDIFGDGVNVASRIEKFAEPGGFAVSSAVFREIQHNIDVEFVSLGSKRVRNISRPIMVYRSAGARGTLQAHLARLRAAVQTPAFRVAAGFVFIAFVVGALYVEQAADRTQASIPPQTNLLSVPTGPSIAVLPFNNMSGDKAQEFFADGITEEIISDLAQFRDLRVLGRNTTFRYKNMPVDIRALGQELGVQYVLEGSVRRANTSVRVTAQLIDTANGSHLWTSSFDRTLTPADIIAVQDEISEKVVGALATPYGAINQSRVARPSSPAPSNLSAYECVLRYYAHASRPTADSQLAVHTCLENAIADEPDYTEAWAALAMARLDEFRIGLVPLSDDADILKRALSAAEQAVALDPQSALAHQALFLVQFHRGEIDKFRYTAAKALELNPNHADMVADYALCLVLIGEDAKGIALARKALALSPQYAPWYHAAPALHYMRNGDYAKALRHTEALDAGELFWSKVILAALHGHMGNDAAAKAAVDGLLTQKPDFPIVAGTELAKWHMAGDLQKAIVEGLKKAGLKLGGGDGKRHPRRS